MALVLARSLELIVPTWGLSPSESGPSCFSGILGLPGPSGQRSSHHGSPLPRYTAETFRLALGYSGLPELDRSADPRRTCLRDCRCRWIAVSVLQAPRPEGAVSFPEAATGCRWTIHVHEGPCSPRSDTGLASLAGRVLGCPAGAAAGEWERGDSRGSTHGRRAVIPPPRHTHPPAPPTGWRGRGHPRAARVPSTEGPDVPHVLNSMWRKPRKRHLAWRMQRDPHRGERRVSLSRRGPHELVTMLHTKFTSHGRVVRLANRCHPSKSNKKNKLKKNNSKQSRESLVTGMAGGRLRGAAAGVGGPKQTHGTQLTRPAFLPWACSGRLVTVSAGVCLVPAPMCPLNSESLQVTHQ